MKMITRKLIATIAAFAVAFTCAAAAMGSITADAASAPAMVKSIGGAYSHNYVTVKWGRVAKNLSGYVIYKNGKAYKTILLKNVKYADKKKNTAFYKDTAVKANTNYNYYVRAFRYTGKTKTQWYNKQTGKWQDKKPAKKYLGKSRNVRLVQFGKASSTLKLKTKAAPKKTTTQKTTAAKTVKKSLKVEGPTTTNNDITIKWSASSGFTQFKLYRNNTLIKTLDKSARSYTDKNQAWGNTYSYRVEAYEGSKLSLKATASISLPASGTAEGSSSSND